MEAAFEEAQSAVISFMQEGGYSKSYVSCARSALRDFREHLKVSGSEPSEAVASEWLDGERAARSPKAYSARRLAVMRLMDALRNGRVTIGRFPNGGPAAYDSLPKWARDVVDEFSPTASDPGDARTYCSQFLLVAAKLGSDRPEGIAPEHVAAWIEALPRERPGQTTNWQRMGHVRRMLSSLGGAVSPEAVELVDATVLRRRDMLSSPGPDRLPDVAPTATAREVLSIATELHSVAMPEAGYGRTSICTMRAVGNVLFSFLSLNGLGFSSELALAWAEAHADGLGCLLGSWRRAILAIDVYRAEGRVPTCEVLDRGDPLGGIPGWARRDVASYLGLRRREGMAESTLKNDLWACGLLSAHADACGVTSFAQLTPEIVMGFARDACGALALRSMGLAVSMSRGFLGWLADEGVVPRSLVLAAKSSLAPSTRVVSVLSDAQVARIREFRSSASTPMELRDAAMVSLGLWEGLRACDVCSLELGSIDWRSSTLTLVQRKTHAQIELPLMPEAGNSVAAWIARGRPEADSPRVFVRARPPHVALASTTACETALRRSLGDLYGDCTGFHELRRTFATGVLRGGAGEIGVAEALGHRTTANARSYMSLDGERMALCAMPLGVTDVPSRRGGGWS